MVSWTTVTSTGAAANLQKNLRLLASPGEKGSCNNAHWRKACQTA
jgi:hypothetical protein